jgi:hypothetical protein
MDQTLLTAETSSSSSALSYSKLRQSDLPPLPARLFQRKNKKGSPFAWGLADDGDGNETRALAQLLLPYHRGKEVGRAADRACKELLEQWLEADSRRAATPQYVLQSLAWAAAAPQLTRVLARPLWERLMRSLDEQVTTSPPVAAREDPLRFHLSAELGLWLAGLFPDMPRWIGHFAAGREALTHGICELTDGEGMPSEQHLPLMRPLLACWTRCLSLAEWAGQKSCLHTEGTQQAVWLLRQAILLTRPDGRQVLGDGSAGSWNPALFRGALQLLPSATNNRLALQLLPEGEKLVRGLRISSHKKKLPPASTISEWAELAVLRSSWSVNSPQYSLTFGRGQIAGELSVRQHPVWSGNLLPEIRIDGENRQAAGDITMACQFQDKEVDYVELQWDLCDQWQVQRQVLLARDEQLLFVADAILGTKAARIEYRQQLPLCGDIAFQPAQETREGTLRCGQHHVARVLPLALGEWRSQPVQGQLLGDTSGLVLEQQSQTSALFCPLLLDLSRRRRDLPLTWRSLTVGEDRQRQPPHVAVGYRAQIGRRQWLIYRSLAGRACRTVLGQHFQYEFVVGRLARKGEFDTLVQIEAADE